MKTVLLAFTALILTSMAMGQNSIELPAPVKTGGMPLMEALSKRATDRLMDPRARWTNNSCRTCCGRHGESIAPTAAGRPLRR